MNHVLNFVVSFIFVGSLVFAGCSSDSLVSATGTDNVTVVNKNEENHNNKNEENHNNKNEENHNNKNEENHN